jgi:hypothetical protein
MPKIPMIMRYCTLYHIRFDYITFVYRIELIIAESLDAEWVDEDEIDISGLLIF